jgi:hypothetical protein
MNTSKLWQDLSFVSLPAFSMAFVLVGSGCSDGGVTASRDAEVERVAGGGMQGARIDKSLGVVVLDSVTDLPLSGAQIWVGEGDSAKAAGVTDDRGQLRVDEVVLQDLLAGKDSVAVTAVRAGYVTTSYVGVDRDSLTIAARSTTPDSEAEATIDLTYRQFESVMPQPAAGEYLIALATVSKDIDFLDDGLDDARAAPAPATCRWVNNRTPCILPLKAAPGTRTLFALAAKGKDMGTPADESDDELEIVDLLSTTVDLAPGSNEGKLVDALGASKLAALSLVAGAGSGDLAKVVGVPGINRSGDVMVFPSPAGKVTRWVVPLANEQNQEFANEVLWGVATASNSDGSKRARVVRRGIEAPKQQSTTPIEVTTPAFLGPPTLLLQSRALVVESPAEATLQRVRLKRGSEILLEALMIRKIEFTPPATLITSGTAEAEIASLEATVDTEYFSLRESFHTLSRDAAAQASVTLP